MSVAVRPWRLAIGAAIGFITGLMLWLCVLLLLTACQHAPQLVPESVFLPPYCTSNAKYPSPPRTEERTVQSVMVWARAAAKAANAAIAERDECAQSYAQIRSACSTSAGCIIRRGETTP